MTVEKAGERRMIKKRLVRRLFFFQAEDGIRDMGNQSSARCRR